MGKRNHKPDDDGSFDAFLNSMLKPGDDQVPFYCGKHGKHLVLKIDGQPPDQPLCSFCKEPMHTEDEWLYRGDVRKQRTRRVNILRNYLEG